ncbi:MAG: hypothetical protein V3S16_01455 [Candidatus Desulfatibia sp.]|uniref:hypothetical protein n=1 Tax=Candidatus Desulfatibia sp. TaxID=3101189 RepID=UPI002F2C1A4D
MREKSDKRILGSGEFVEQLIKQSDQTRKEQFSVQERLHRVAKHVEKICKKESVSVEALKSGSRRQKVSMDRSQLGKKLDEEWRLSLAETGRYLGVSLSAITKILYRLDKHKSN